MPLKWSDAEEIALLLQESDPGLDPLSVRFPELRDRVLALNEFDDDPALASEKALETIQMTWSEEFEGG